MPRIPSPSSLLFALCALAVLPAAGCQATSNLDKRPQWAFSAGAEIPSTHPQFNSYPNDQFMTFVSEGTGDSPSVAKSACELKARAEFAKRVFVKVQSQQNIDSAMKTTFDKKGESEEGESLVRTSIQTVTKQFLAAMKAIDSWDQGFVRKGKVTTHYAYGAFVLEKASAGRQSLSHAKNCLAALKGIVGESSMSAATGVDGLRYALEFDLASTSANFFGQKAPRETQIGAWKSKFKSAVIDECTRLVSTRDQSNLERALGYYNACAKLDPEGGWEGKILAIKRQLPCTLCNGGKLCTNCSGNGGFSEQCKVCGGSKIARPQCRKCNGSGLERCPRCNGKTTIKTKCPPKIKCKTCAGGGRLSQVCDKCDGTGTIVQRRPNGTTYNENCGFCLDGKGQSTGQRVVTCYVCNGGGQQACDICNGTGKKNEGCPKCNGRGRFGDCKLCYGKGVLEETCNNCDTNGKVFRKCKECNGSKKCKVCKGRGYRS